MTDSSRTRRTDEAPRHSGLRLRVYRINAVTGVHTELPAVDTTPGAPLISNRYPLCLCGSPRCPDRKARGDER
ncbi:hypothetical protein GCM10027091_33930 [Streptomyces daliensis]